MKLRIYQSDKGDCLLLTSAARKPVRVLVDGGMADSYVEHVAPDLAKLDAPLDVVYVSHIDEDHISGVLQMMDDLVDWRVYDYQKQKANPKARPPAHPRPPGAKKIWHNAFHELVGDNAGPIEEMLAASTAILSASALKSALEVREEHQSLIQSQRQAMQLARRVGSDQLGIPVNPEFGHKLMLVKDDTPKIKVGTLQFYLLGPFDQDLRQLRKEWNEWLTKNKKAVLDIRRQARDDQDRFASDVDRLLAPLTSGAKGFTEAQLEFTKTLGKRGMVTTPNLASLMFLVQERKQRVLLTGDGHSDDIRKGLDAHNLLDADGRIHVDVIKFQHHGSEHNVDAAFCRDITAGDYVFCGNGFAENPELDVIDTLVAQRSAARPDKPFALWFNSGPKFTKPTYKAYMTKLRARVDKHVKASKGRITAHWISGSFVDL